MAETIHQGRNIKRFRELFGIKQEALAIELGDDWNQKKVSLLESKEVIEDGLLEQVAKVLKVPKGVIENLTDEGAVNIISNTFHDTKGLINYNPSYNFNPIDEWKESTTENKKLLDEIRKLYERLLQAEREKNELLQRMLDAKN